MSLLQDIWTSFRAVWGPVTAPVAIVLAVVGGLYTPGATVQVRLIWIIVALLVVSIILMTAIELVAQARRDRGRFPRACHAAQSPAGAVTLLLEPSGLFGFNVLVAIYYTEAIGGRIGPYERLVGIGRVSNIQGNGYIQVHVLREIDCEAELWGLIRAQRPPSYDRIIVKPSVPYDWAGNGGVLE